MQETTIPKTIKRQRTTWSHEQELFAEDFLIKASKRLLLEQQASLYYQRRHYFVSIPSLIIGTITTGASFSNWSNEVLCEKASWVWLIVASLYALTTILNSLTDHVLNYKILSSKHHETYKGLSRLIKSLSQELNNPRSDRQPYREFIEKIIAEYNHYTDESELIPRAVSKMVNKMLEAAEMRQNQKRALEGENTPDVNYFPSNELPPDYASPGVFSNRKTTTPKSSLGNESTPSLFMTPHKLKPKAKKEKSVSSSTSTPRDRSLANCEEFPANSALEIQMSRSDEREERHERDEKHRKHHMTDSFPKNPMMKIVPHDIVLGQVSSVRRQSVMDCVDVEDITRMSDQRKQKEKELQGIWTYRMEAKKNYSPPQKKEEESATPEQIIEIVKSETSSRKKKLRRRRL